MIGIGQQPDVDGDDVLMGMAGLGDRAAFETIVHRQGPRLYRYARRMLANESDAADVVQATLLSAWEQLGSYRGEASPRNWLFAICSIEITDAYRATRTQTTDDALRDRTGGERGRDPFTVASNSAFLTELEAALGDLPPRQRAAWVLREVEAMTFAEVGEILGTSPDAARGHHCRATATLRTRMTPSR